MSNGKVLLSIRKITGEVCEVRVDPEDKVRVVKRAIANELQVHAMCQELWLNDASEVVAKNCVPHMVKQLADLTMGVGYTIELTEVLAFQRLPPGVEECMAVVLHLLCASSRIQIDSKDGLPDGKDGRWNQCRRMLQDFNFSEAVRNFSDDICNGRLTEVQVAAAQGLIDGMAGNFSDHFFRRTSAFCSLLCNWALASLKLYQVLHWTGGAMHLDDGFPLSVYSSGEDTLELALIVEVERVFAALEQPGDEDLEAFKAIATVGSKFPERTLKSLAGSLVRRKWSGHALEAIKSVWSPEDEIAAKLDAEIPCFFREGSIRRQDPLEALEYLGPGHPRLLARAATGLLAGGVGQIEDREFCLQMFLRLQGELDPKVVVEALGKALFHPAMSRQSVHEAPLRDNLKFLFQALEAAAERDYTSAVHSIVEHLKPSEDAWVRAVAACAAQHFVAKEDERVVEAFQNSFDERLTGMYLQRVALSFREISSSANPFISPLCAELVAGRNAPEVLATIKAINPVDNETALMALMSHLGRCCGTVEDLLNAVALIDQVAQSDRSYVSQAYALLMEALASMLTRSPDKKVASVLMEAAEAHGGASDAVLLKLADAFTSCCEPLRNCCEETMLNVKKSNAASNLLQEKLLSVIHERFSVQSCCTAIHALQSMASPEQMTKFVTPRFLELLAVEKDCTLKCALLEALQREKPLPTEISQIGQRLLCDPVETVRLYSLRLFRNETVDVKMLLQCIQDPSFSVCHLAFEMLNSLPSEQIDTAEIATVVTHVLRYHRDAQIRSSCIEVLSKMTRHRNVAVQALSREGPWPELELDIRKKRQDAIAKLEVE